MGNNGDHQILSFLGDAIWLYAITLWIVKMMEEQDLSLQWGSTARSMIASERTQAYLAQKIGQEVKPPHGARVLSQNFEALVAIRVKSAGIEATIDWVAEVLDQHIGETVVAYCSNVDGKNLPGGEWHYTPASRRKWLATKDGTDISAIGKSKAEARNNAIFAHYFS